MKVKGWKCFDENLKCRGHQFKVGETYSVDGDLVLCKNGFHFHENRSDLFNYYPNNIFKTRVCEIEAEDVITGDDKSVCRSIKILREMKISEISNLYNGSALDQLLTERNKNYICISSR